MYKLPTAFQQPAPLDSKTISTLSYITKKVVADASNAPSGIDATSFESSLPTTEETRNTNSPSTKELDKQSSIKEEEHLKETEPQRNHLRQSALQG